MADVTVWRDVAETPTLKRNKIVYTAGSTITIDAPAEKVFDVIMAFDKYGEWNSFVPRHDFPQGEPVVVGSRGTMFVRMEAQKRNYEVPQEILELERDPAQYKLTWRGMLLPSWAGVAERVQTVTPVEGSNGQRCTLKQWESFSGLSAYIFKYLMGIPAQLDGTNAQYSRDLKARAESLYGPSASTAST